MLRTFVQFSILFLTAIASFFWIRGSICVSTKDIASLAGTTWVYNLATLKSLASQKSDSLIAGLLLLISFIFQCWNTIKPSVIFGNDRRGIVVSVIFSIFILIICNFESTCLTRHYISQAQVQIQENLTKNVGPYRTQG